MSDKKPSKEQLRLMALELEQYESGMARAEDYSAPSVKLPAVKVSKIKREEIFKLRAKNYDNSTIAVELGLSEVQVEDVIERDKQKIKSDQKTKDILEMYQDGYTLEELGEKYKLTRERIRQLIKREVGNQLGYGPAEQRYRTKEITEAVRAVVQISREDRIGDNVEEKLNKALEKGLDPQYFNNFRMFQEATGISKEHLKEYRPDVYKQILTNQRILKSRWHTYYDACRLCGKTENKHRSNGYCTKCYFKSPEWKEMVKLSYQRNKESRQAAFKEYAKDYYNRPEVIEKLDREYDLKFFGGNRKKALERDGYICLGCGMGMEVKTKVGKSKVRHR